ncbi:MAG: anti-sigma factor antagonist [Calditrichaeota bacterium]|nr:STAS domain-containing protein [Calditrichota bacterium]RQW07797.1 MAG: anti-sigma factor antagonist [Calditrichota bacterium]
MVEINEITDGDIRVLAVFGKMLDANSMKLSDKVKSYANSGVRKLIIDLGQISLLNSSYGLGVLAACWGYMNRVNGKLLFANPSPKVQRLLEITKLNQVFEIFETVDAAKKCFQ